MSFTARVRDAWARLASKQRHREARGLPTLDRWLQDLRDALRSLRRSRGFTCTAVATLAVGIGANAAIFTIADAALFRGFAQVEGNERLLYVGTQNGGRGCCVSYPDFLDWRAQATSFEDLGAVADLRITFNDSNGFAESYSATLVTANAFQLLGQQPVAGRDFSTADLAPGGPGVAILTDRFWARRYGRDPSAIGRTVRVNGAPTTIVGVMPAGWSFPQNQDLWLPLVPTPELERREARGLWFAFGRLKQGVTIEGARADLETIGRRLEADYPQTNRGWVPQPRDFAAFFVGPNATTSYGVLWGAVGFVLLIACANLANLLVARGMDRTREISLRMALGASRWQIVRQLLVESLLLSAAGGVAGWWVAVWSVRVYELTATPPTLTWSAGLFNYAMDARVLAYVVMLSIGTAVLFGVAPALRCSSPRLSVTLKDGGRGIAGARGTRLPALLVIGEIALAVVLLVGAGLMMRTFVQLYSAPLGVNADDTVVMLLNLPEATEPGPEGRAALLDRLEARLAVLPGVDSVSVASVLPTGSTTQLPYEVADAPLIDGQNRPLLSTLTIGPAYFLTVGATMTAGREFEAADRGSSPLVVIVNQRFADRHWPGENPIGQRLRLFDGAEPGAWRTVVGVASNIAQNDATRSRREFDPLVYVPYQQRPSSSMWVLLRTRLPVSGVANASRRVIQSLDPNLPIWLGPYSLEQRLAGQGTYWRTGKDAVLLVIFAGLALLLAATGLYAVIAHDVGRRTQEIGVRMAVGGTPGAIVRLVCKQGASQVAIGLVAGIVGALVVTRVLTSTLVNVSPADPLTYAVASVVLIAAAALGCLIPARRAMRVDPIVALRHD